MNPSSVLAPQQCPMYYLFFDARPEIKILHLSVTRFFTSKLFNESESKILKKEIEYMVIPFPTRYYNYKAKIVYAHKYLDENLISK